MPQAPVRANTHLLLPPSWTDAQVRSPSLSYRQFNTDCFEPWLRKAYAPSVKPFYEGPAHVHAHCVGGAHASRLVDRLQIVQRTNQILLQGMASPIHPYLVEQWNQVDSEYREGVCLSVWEQGQRTAEEMKTPYGRCECDELSLDWAQDASNLSRLVDSLVFERDSDFRLPRSAAWERLNDASTSSLPNARALRAFTEERRLTRAHYLFDFVIGIFRTLGGNPQQKVVPLEPDRRALAAGRKDHDGIRLRNGGTGAVAGERLRGLRMCAHCLEAMDASKLRSCAKCLSSSSFPVAQYCSRPCQVAAWPKHKLQCGRPLDTPSLRSTKATVTPSQLDCLQWMMEYPLTFWGDRIEVRDEDGAFSCREEYHFSLRPFIRPFVPALSRLTSIRNAAVKEKDEGALGVLALFIRALSDTDSVSGPRPLPTLQHLRMLAVFCEVELVEVERCLQIAEEQIGEREPMLASVLKQIQSGEVDVTHPHQLLSHCSLDHINLLLGSPSLILSLPLPGLTDRFPVSLSPSLPSANTVLSIVREVAFQALSTSGQDEEALGLWLLVACAVGPANDDSLMQSQLKEALFESLEEGWGLSEGSVKKAVEAAEKKLKDRTDDDGALLQKTVVHLRATRPRVSEDGELTDDNFSYSFKTVPDEDEGPTATNTTTSASRKKRKNKKKKKKSAAATTDVTGGGGVEVVVAMEVEEVE